MYDYTALIGTKVIYIISRKFHSEELGENIKISKRLEPRTSGKLSTLDIEPELSNVLFCY